MSAYMQDVWAVWLTKPAHTRHKSNLIERSKRLAALYCLSVWLRSSRTSWGVFVKDLPLIWFIYMATSKPFVDTPMGHSSCFF